MAKKRRKIDKIRAKERLTTKVEKKSSKISVEKHLKKENDVAQDRVVNLFNYDPRLIGDDLKKTLLITLVVLVVLALITLRYT